MSKLFEAFKKYHNANYHDGENHFDDEIYRKSNGEDFDNEFVQECFDHFEAAWQEQQNVIDKLESQLRGQKIALDIFSQNERCKHFSTTMFHNGKAECFQCNAIVNEKREVIGQQGKGLFNKESEP